jgi:hypothetical protein
MTGQIQIASMILHFVNKNQIETFEGNKKLLKLYPIS